MFETRPFLQIFFLIDCGNTLKNCKLICFSVTIDHRKFFRRGSNLLSKWKLL